MKHQPQTPNELKESPYAKDYEGLKIDQLAEIMRDLAQERAELESQATAVYKRWDYIRKVAMINALEEAGMSKCTVDGVGTVSTASDMFTKTLDSTGLAEWLVENGAGDLIKDTINSSSLKSYLRELIEKGEDLPSEFVDILPYSFAKITKA